MTDVAEIALITEKPRPPICRDHDEDCEDIADKVHCYLYDPAKGRCPYLTQEQPR